MILIKIFLNAFGFVKSYFKRGEDNTSILELNKNIDLISVVGQDELVCNDRHKKQFNFMTIYVLYQSIFNYRTWARLPRLTGGRRKEMLQRFKNQESTCLFLKTDHNLNIDSDIC